MGLSVNSRLTLLESRFDTQKAAEKEAKCRGNAVWTAAPFICFHRVLDF